MCVCASVGVGVDCMLSNLDARCKAWPEVQQKQGAWSTSVCVLTYVNLVFF